MGVYISDSDGNLKKYSGLSRTPDKVGDNLNQINSILTKTEQVEVIYDKDDSTKDWGYSGGMTSVTVYDKDFSKYKRLRLYIDETWRKGICEIDLTKLTASGEHIGTNCYDYEATSVYTLAYNCYAAVQSNKTVIFIDCYRYYNTTKESYGVVVKIEGVY